jgi:hypothetical protein
MRGALRAQTTKIKQEPPHRRFNRYSSKKTWPQPAAFFCKEAELAALEMKELNLGHFFINDLNQLREQYKRELAQIRLHVKERQKREEETRKICWNEKSLLFDFLCCTLFFLMFTYIKPLVEKNITNEKLVIT